MPIEKVCDLCGRWAIDIPVGKLFTDRCRGSAGGTGPHCWTDKKVKKRKEPEQKKADVGDIKEIV